MFERAVRSAAVLGLCAFIGALTWMLSWLAQYICAITIPGQEFHPTAPAANRLAVVTVVAAVVVAVAFMLLQVMDGADVFVLIIFCGAAILVGIGWVATHTFPGTTVTTTPAQLVYGGFVLAWGVLMWYVFLKGLTED